MSIKIDKMQIKQVEFKDLKPSTIFRIKSMIALKTETIYGLSGEYNAVDMKTGQCYRISDDRLCTVIYSISID